MSEPLKCHNGHTKVGECNWTCSPEEMNKLISLTPYLRNRLRAAFEEGARLMQERAADLAQQTKLSEASWVDAVDPKPTDDRYRAKSSTAFAIEMAIRSISVHDLWKKVR